MAPTVYELDPDGDAIIVLKNPGAPFAVWQEPSIPLAAPPPFSPSPVSVAQDDSDDLAAYRAKRIGKKKKKSRKSAKLDNHPEDSIAGPSNSVAEEINVVDRLMPVVDESMTRIEPTSSLHEAVQEPISPSDFPTSETEREPDENTIHYRVSSRHLVLSSGYYKRFLGRGEWRDSRPDASDGKYHLDAENWDPEAFLILLQILHLKFDAVPENLGLEMLAKMAVLVDIYECTEAVKLCSKMWTSAAKASSPVPATYSRDLVLWMLIAWVFKLSDVFKETTKISIRQAETPSIQEMELPIPKPSNAHPYFWVPCGKKWIGLNVQILGLRCLFQVSAWSGWSLK